MSSTTGTAGAAAAAIDAVDWRTSVPQSYRSTEVNEIAKVLASLAGATQQSKLVLASNFEEQMFRKASDLRDYQKLIRKRLKRVQKKSTAVVAGGEGADGAAGGPNAAGGEHQGEQTAEQLDYQIQSMKRSLRVEYQSRLKLIVENAGRTVEKYNKDSTRGKTLGKHFDKAIEWAVDIGAVPDDGTVKKVCGNEVYWGRFGDNMNTTDVAPKKQELRYLQEIEKELKDRLKNLWFYVLKSTDGSQFILEQLKEMENSLVRVNCQSYDGAQEKMIDFSATLAKGVLEEIEKEKVGLNSAISRSTNAASVVENKKVEAIQKMLENIRSVVPVPRGPQEEKEACLTYLSKIRDACKICFNYITLMKGDNVDGKNARLEVKGSIVKAHDAVIEACNFLEKGYKGVEDDVGSTTMEDGSSSVKPAIKLEDAWNKLLKYEKDGISLIDQETNLDSQLEDGPDKKKLRIDSADKESAIGSTSSNSTSLQIKKKKIQRVVIRTRILFRNGRVPPTMLTNFLTPKGVRWIQDGNTSSTVIKVPFGNAFEMSIYCSPLLVTIRALSQNQSRSTTTTTTAADESKSKVSSTMSTFRNLIVNGGQPTWKSAYFGLGDNDKDIKNSTTATTTTTTKRRKFQVMGVVGDLETVGMLVAKQLEFASAQATRVLRRCFADSVSHTSYTSDNEIEILEGSAMIKFIKIAKDTYTPNWASDDV